MRPTPIPDDEIWDGAVRRVIAAPDGALDNTDIAPVEALIDRSPSTGAVNLSVRCVLEDGDIEKLAAGGTVWLTFWGAMVPWSATVAAPTQGVASARQVWERPVVPGTDPTVDPVAARLHLEVDAVGRAYVHEAVLAQLLVDAGWERTR